MKSRIKNISSILLGLMIASIFVAPIIIGLNSSSEKLDKMLIQLESYKSEIENNIGRNITINDKQYTIVNYNMEKKVYILDNGNEVHFKFVEKYE